MQIFYFMPFSFASGGMLYKDCLEFPPMLGKRVSATFLTQSNILSVSCFVYYATSLKKEKERQKMMHKNGNKECLLLCFFEQFLLLLKVLNFLGVHLLFFHQFFKSVIISPLFSIIIFLFVLLLKLTFFLL